MDMNDRSLRHIIVGFGRYIIRYPTGDRFRYYGSVRDYGDPLLIGKFHGSERTVGKYFHRLYLHKRPLYARDLKAHGRWPPLLKDAIKPNLVQTIEGIRHHYGGRLPILLRNEFRTGNEDGTFAQILSSRRLVSVLYQVQKILRYQVSKLVWIRRRRSGRHDPGAEIPWRRESRKSERREYGSIREKDRKFESMLKIWRNSIFAPSLLEQICQWYRCWDTNCCRQMQRTERAHGSSGSLGQGRWRSWETGNPGSQSSRTMRMQTKTALRMELG